MSPSANVLVSAAGRRTSLVRAFVDATNAVGGRTLAADADPLAPALYLADDALRLPRVDDPTYVTDLVDIVRGCKVGLLVPTIDPDLPVLARNRENLLGIGCVAAVSDESFVRITFDKYETVSAFGARGVAVPASWLPSEPHADLPHRLYVKPRRGSASLGTYSVAREGLGGVLPLVPDPIIQELLVGPEITIDALLDLGGRPIHYVPRRRIKTIGGESIEGVTLEHDARLEGWIVGLLELCGSLGARGPLCLQAFLTDRGPVLSEINPRFGGGFPLTRAAGGEHPAWLLEMAVGGSVPPQLGHYEPGLYMTRYYVEHFTRTPKW